MNEHVDVMDQVRESFSALHMDRPVENVLARGRARRRRRLAALTAAAAGTAGAAAAVTLALGGAAPAHPGNLPGHPGNPPAASRSTVRLAAYSVISGPRDSTTLILHKGAQYPALDPSAVRQALAQHGIPALVTVGTFCRPANGVEAGFDQFVHPATLPDGSAEMVIDGSAMPAGTTLSIGYFPNYVRMAVFEDGAALSCSSASSGQPAVHNLPSGN
jgi:hypothetical protein